jgi:GntR family transcriptional repressor for pyruvate dehydrogenase complex
MTTSDSPIAPVQIVSAHELVLEQINTALALGRFRAGDTLPRERDLADMLQVSRATVREALAVLASQGTIEVRRGRNGGLYVRERSMEQDERLELLRKNRERLHQTFEYRLVVESAGARFAAQRRTPEQVADLQAHVVAMQGIEDRIVEEYDPKLVTEFLAVDNDFHLGIARASDNPWIAEATLHARVEMFRPVGAIFERLEPNANHLHAQICAAIAARDDESAARWMTEHIEETQASVEAWLSPQVRSSNL